MNNLESTVDSFFFFFNQMVIERTCPGQSLVGFIRPFLALTSWVHTQAAGMKQNEMAYLYVVSKIMLITSSTHLFL